MPSIALQALFSFWIFQKKSQKLLRCGPHSEMGSLIAAPHPSGQTLRAEQQFCAGKIEGVFSGE